MSDFPSLDDFESGTTTVQRQPHIDSDSQFLTSDKFPEIGESGDLLNAESQFDSSFPAIPDHARPNTISTPQDQPIPSHESEKITQWRTKQASQIQARDEQSTRIKEQRKKAAQAAVDDFYESYNSRRDAKIATLRKEEESRLSERDESTSGGTSWDRVLKFCDLKEKRGDADLSRMRELLISLAKDKNAPSAGL